MSYLVLTSKQPLAQVVRVAFPTPTLPCPSPLAHGNNHQNRGRGHFAVAIHYPVNWLQGVASTG
jgi:hypothetical protein